MENLLHKPETKLNDFVVSILDKPFTTPEEITYPKTAQVNFFDRRNKKIDTIEYGYREADELYDLLETQKINLNDCYVKNFSLAEYRTRKQLQTNHPIVLSKFSAKNSFFDCDVTTDFSFVHFQANKISFESAIFSSGINNFTGAHFGNATVSFRRTRFGDGTIDFRFAEFGEGNTSFHYSHFGDGDVFFVNTNFGNSNIDFRTVTFGDGDVDFKYAKFGTGDISFEKTVFGKGKKDFKAVEFGDGRVDFKRVQFNDGDISFEGAEAKDGRINFRLSIFGKGNIDFELADFGKSELSFEKVEFTTGKVSFHKVKAKRVSFKASQLNAYFNFKFAECELLDLSDTIIRDVIDFYPEDFPVNISILDVNGMKKLGRIIIDWKTNFVRALIYNQQGTTTFRQKANQFRILKEEFNNAGKYNDEDRAYVEFKRCEQKAYLQVDLQGNFFSKLRAYPLYVFKWLVFDKMGRYATSPMRVITSMSIIYIIFSVLYYVLPFFISASLQSSLQLTDAHSLAVAFYYSAVTFFTIGYGDYYPLGYFRVAATTEGFLGMFLMSYFVVAFVRKILR